MKRISDLEYYTNMVIGNEPMVGNIDDISFKISELLYEIENILLDDILNDKEKLELLIVLLELLKQHKFFDAYKLLSKIRNIQKNKSNNKTKKKNKTKVNFQ